MESVNSPNKRLIYWFFQMHRLSSLGKEKTTPTLFAFIAVGVARRRHDSRWWPCTIGVDWVDCTFGIGSALWRVEATESFQRWDFSPSFAKKIHPFLCSFPLNDSQKNGRKCKKDCSSTEGWLVATRPRPYDKSANRFHLLNQKGPKVELSIPAGEAPVPLRAPTSLGTYLGTRLDPKKRAAFQASKGNGKASLNILNFVESFIENSWRLFKIFQLEKFYCYFFMIMHLCWSIHLKMNRMNAETNLGA